MVHALDFNAYWVYRQSGGEGRPTREEFFERYSLGVGPQLTYKPTHALVFDAAINYSRVQRNSERGQITETQITPSAGLTLLNDIFLAQLAGSATRYESDLNEDVFHSWDASLASRWEIPLWPVVRLNYGQRDYATGDGQLFRLSDTRQTYESLSVGWDLRLAQLDYRFSSTTVENIENGAGSDNETHFAQIESRGRFLRNRIGYTLTQQVQKTTTAFAIGHLDENGFFAVELEGGRLAKIDSPADPAPDEVGYDDPATDIAVSPLEVGIGERLHLRFGDTFGFPQQIDAIRLFFDQFGAPLDDLEWTVYLRDISGTWVPQPETVVGVINTAAGYLELPVGQIANEVLLVAVNTLGVPLTLNDLHAFSLVNGRGGGTSWSYLTNAGLQVQLTKTLTSSTNVTLEQLERESATADSEISRRSLSTSLRWRPRPWISPVAGFSESREEADDGIEQLTRSYSLLVGTVPLPTLRTSFGVTRSERFTDERKTSEILRYSVTTTASLYPDLNAALFLTWQESENLVPGDEEGEEDFAERSQFSARLDFNARLRPKLFADLVTNYRTVDTGGAPIHLADTSLNLQYRPSSLLALRGFYNAHFLDNERSNSMGAGMTVAVLHTYKTRLDLTYGVSYEEELSQNVSLYGTWAISKNLSLQVRGNYALNDESLYSFSTGLNLKL